MIDLLQRLLAITLLRSGPQDLPAGATVMPICLGLYVLVTSISLVTSQPPDNPVVVMTLALAVPLILSRIILIAAGKVARWGQTVSALFGTSAVLSALSLPFGLTANGQPSAFTGLFLVLLFFWSLAVNGHIWRHALEISFGGGLAISVVTFAATLFVINALTGSL